MNVFRHDSEAVKVELALLAVTEKGLEEKVSVSRFLKVTKLKESRD